MKISRSTSPVGSGQVRLFIIVKHLLWQVALNDSRSFKGGRVAVMFGEWQVVVHRSFIVNLRQVLALERTESSSHAVLGLPSLFAVLAGQTLRWR